MSSSSQNQPMDQGFGILLALGFAAVIGWLIWHFFKQPLLEILRWMRFGELWLVNIVAGGKYDACLDWLRFTRFGNLMPSPEVAAYTQQCFGSSTTYYDLSIDPLSAIENVVMRYLRWPIAAFFGFLGYYVMYLSPRNRFKTAHNLESFIKTQSGMWPVITPITKFNPMTTSARSPGDTMPDKIPLFAEAFAPEEWISYHRIKVTNNIPDRDSTRRAFLLQLGPRWTGNLSAMPPYIKALVAAFALKGIQKREDSDDLLGRVAVCWEPNGRLNLTGELSAEIEKILKDEKIGGQALAVANQHAYRTTALLGMLRWARARGGVLAPAQFLWLRGTDRNLWYGLNNLGRRAYLSEGAGAMAHYMAEQNARKPLPIPRIDTAIVTLNQYMAERGMPIPPRENSDQ